MLLTDWGTIREILIVGVVTYAFFILTLRTFGKRSLSQMNAYDFSVTVAFGSILASTLTNSNLSALAGIVSFTLLIAMQYIIAKLAVHLSPFNKLLKASPTLLFYKGKYDEKQMKSQRVTKDDLLQTARLQGHASMDQVLAIIMEANGKLSVLQYQDSYPSNSTLQNIDHPFLREDSETNK